MKPSMTAVLITLSLVLTGCTVQSTESEPPTTPKPEDVEISGDADKPETDSDADSDLDESQIEAPSEKTVESDGDIEEKIGSAEIDQENSPSEQLENSEEPKDTNQPISLENLVPGETHIKAWDSVEDARASQNGYVPEIDFYISPKLQAERPERVEIEKAALKTASTLWSSSFKPEIVQIIYVSNNDPDEKRWFGETVEELGGLEYMIDWSSFYDSECGARLIRGARASNFEGVYTMVACIAGPVSTRALHTQPHEYTHFYQYSNNNIPDNGPPWLTEGGATFYGMALAFKNRSDREESRYLFYRNMTYGFDQKSGNSRGDYIDRSLSWTSADFVSLMTNIETNRTSHDAATLYLFGALASEALVASFGHNAMEAFHKSFNSSLDWKSSFRQVFGISTAAFYEKLFPYVKAELEVAGKTPGI